MKRIFLFTDVSLNPELKLGVGAYLVVPASLLELSSPRIERSELAERVVVRRFEGTSSTRLEVQTVLWALKDFRNELQVSGPGKLIVFSDSQCVAGLLGRRPGLEANDFHSKRTNRPLRNFSLYRTFYELHDELGFEVIKVAGHTSSCSHDTVHRLFSYVDREARQTLNLWMGKCEVESLEPIK